MTTNFYTNVFHCCFWIRDPRSGRGEIRIRDKHPGSATLRKTKVLWIRDVLVWICI
jgi:hypothetical protein